MAKDPTAALRERFAGRFGGAPRIFRAPGRVNLIGEHTDYTQGLVLPAAIDRYARVAIAPREDRRVVVRSIELDDEVAFELDDAAPAPRCDWSDYPRGVALELGRLGRRLAGANLLLTSEVPLGAGLSSSAALEVAAGFALLSVAGYAIDRLALARACQAAEGGFVGTRCGIMDQFVAVFGTAGHALLLDCRSLEYQTLAIPADARLVICNSMVKHELASGEYNRRRADCEAGVKIFRQSMPQVRALRDVGVSDLERHRDALPEEIFRRCRHVVSENQRVLDAAEALRSSDLHRFGQLMYESHRSLRDDYEVSSKELDLLVEIAASCEGVFGARMTGGGFGGCTITLVRSSTVEAFREIIVKSYTGETGLAPDVYVCSAAQGAGMWQPPS